MISGLYITEIKSVRGGRIETPQTKKGLRVRLSEKLLKKSKELNDSAKKEDSGKKQKEKTNIQVSKTPKDCLPEFFGKIILKLPGSGCCSLLHNHC